MSSENERDDALNPQSSDPSEFVQPDGAGPEINQEEEAAEGAGGADMLPELEKRIRELEEENASLKDQYLRKQADFENFRKRMFREKEESAKYANSQLLQDLITIIDDFERAIKSSEESRNYETFHEGIALIEKQFVSMLERKWGLVRLESAGQPFDPEKHEAINAENREDHEVSMVLEDYQKGYLLNERVLRPAKVKISLPVPKPSEDGDTGNTTE